VADIQAFRPNEGGRVLDRDGATLGRLDYVRRVNVPLDRVPRHVRAAFIAIEDRRFFYHHGVDWRSAGRALVRNVSTAAMSEGFSTITMQVVRNAFVPRLAQQRSLRRKLIEIYLACPDRRLPLMKHGCEIALSHTWDDRASRMLTRLPHLRDAMSQE